MSAINNSLTINNFFTHSFEFCKKQINSLYYLFKRCFFYIRTFVNASERTEYHLFRQLKILSTKTALSDRETAVFMHDAAKLDQRFDDEFIYTHFFRLNDKDSGKEFFASRFIDPNEKTCVRLHELVEILSLKWDYGRDFDEPGMPDFRPAHEQAIKVENLYLLSKAKEMKIPLSLKTLEYVRLPDEAARSDLREFNQEWGIKDVIKRYSKNPKPLPSLEQMKAYVEFMIQSGCIASLPKRYICEKLWGRYMFVTLHQRLSCVYPDENAKTLIFLLKFIYQEGLFEDCIPEKMLDGIEKVVLEVPPREKELISQHLFENLDHLSSHNLLDWPFSNLTRKLLQYIH